MTFNRPWRVLAVAGPAILVLLVGALVNAAFQRNRSETQEVIRTQAIGLELAQLASRLKDAELALRGLYATGDSSYLRSYRGVAVDLAEAIGRLAGLAADAEQERQVARLDSIVRARLAVVDGNVTAWETGQLTVEAAHERLSSGSAMLDQTIGLMTAIRVAHEALMRESAEAELRAARGLATLILVGTLVAVLFALFINWLLARYVAAQEEANLQIEERNELLQEQAVELENQVDELQSQAVQLEDMQVELEASNDELREAHGSLVLRERRFRSLVENSSEVICILDEDGRVTYDSPAIERLLGYAVGERVGTDSFSYVHPDDARKLRGDLAMLAAGGRPLRVEFRVRRRDGSYRVVSATWVNLLDDPAVQGIVANIHDVTDLRESEERFRHSQKMEAIGRLSGGIAHDFNNLLMVIKGSTELALMDLPQIASARADLEEIEAAAMRATNLTRQLLAISRQQVLEPRVLDLNRIVSDLHRMLARTLGEDVELVTLLDPDLGRVMADPGQLEQVLMNLAVNARDAMPKGGKLITETRNIRVGSRYGMLVNEDIQPGDYVLLSVSDTGTGMTREVRERVFEPFYTTKAQGEGTGLGLSTVYGIVKQSGGYVGVASEPGSGTTFQIYLPRVQGELVDDTEPVRPDRPEREVTILLAEDEIAVRTITTRMLKRLGHRVIEAANGEEALRLAEEHSGEFDLLMTDVVMPLMGGGELAQQIRARWPHVHVLFASGYTDETVVRRGALGEGAILLQKPFDYVELAEKVTEVLSGGVPNGAGLARSSSR
jgi:two-component system, cell cycle sensor histidine kinase and response regulator CckA